MRPSANGACIAQPDRTLAPRSGATSLSGHDGNVDVAVENARQRIASGSCHDLDIDAVGPGFQELDGIKQPAIAAVGLRRQAHDMLDVRAYSPDILFCTAEIGKKALGSRCRVFCDRGFPQPFVFMGKERHAHPPLGLAQALRQRRGDYAESFVRIGNATGFDGRLDQLKATQVK